MIELPALQSSFILHGAREMLERYPRAHFLRSQVEALERAVVENPGLAFDLAKSLVECVCKTVLNDQAQPCDEKWDVPKLLRQTLLAMRLIPDGRPNANRVSESLRKAMGGLQTAMQGLDELRNLEGFASHGKDAYTMPLGGEHAEFAARSADTIVLFMLRVHLAGSEQARRRERQYDDYPEFNEYLDTSQEPVAVLDLTFAPSEVLFQLDPEAYEEKLREYLDERGDAA